MHKNFAQQKTNTDATWHGARGRGHVVGCSGGGSHNFAIQISIKRLSKDKQVRNSLAFTTPLSADSSSKATCQVFTDNFKYLSWSGDVVGSLRLCFWFWSDFVYVHFMFC